MLHSTIPTIPGEFLGGFFIPALLFSGRTSRCFIINPMDQHVLRFGAGREISGKRVDFSRNSLDGEQEELSGSGSHYL